LKVAALEAHQVAGFFNSFFQFGQCGLGVFHLNLKIHKQKGAAGEFEKAVLSLNNNINIYSRRLFDSNIEFPHLFIYKFRLLNKACQLYPYVSTFYLQRSLQYRCPICVSLLPTGSAK
jgi:hypothetical protein